MGDLHNQEMQALDERDVCNMSWSETTDYPIPEETVFSEGSSEACNRLKRRLNSDNGYYSRETSLQGPSSPMEDFLTVEKENEFLNHEDFQKLITGQIIRSGEEDTSRKRIRICQQEAFEDKVKGALDKLDQDIELIGDFSRSYALPTVLGKHQDLKSITSKTLFELLSGKFRSDVDSFQLLDCRFPYEFEGGHIQGSKNVYSRGQIDDILSRALNEDKENNSPHKVMIFHCEFSSERAPKLARYLRAKDRDCNASHYPKLNFPEIYILDGGYKSYFNNFPGTCAPQDYLPMLHPDFIDELRHFKAKSKSETNTKLKTARRSIKMKSSPF